VIAVSQHLLGDIKLHGANLREPHKGYWHQPLHSDVQKRFKGDWWLTNSLIMFDDMTLDNGPTRLVPGSQHWPELNVPWRKRHAVEGDRSPTCSPSRAIPRTPSRPIRAR
jgi:ectoine hydroxylase-related dioxygenase (phytanoyl-CoA dioxygenase family)